MGSAGQPWPSSMPAGSRSNSSGRTVGDRAEAAHNKSCSGKLARLAELEALLCASEGALSAAAVAVAVAVNRLEVCSKTENCVSWASNGAVVNVCLLSQTYRQASMLALVHGPHGVWRSHLCRGVGKCQDRSTSVGVVDLMYILDLSTPALLASKSWPPLLVRRGARTRIHI
jgi:hypothetical protein